MFSLGTSLYNVVLVQESVHFKFHCDLLKVLIESANEDLEVARGYVNQVPQDRRLYIPSEGCGESASLFSGVELSRLQGSSL